MNQAVLTNAGFKIYQVDKPSLNDDELLIKTMYNLTDIETAFRALTSGHEHLFKAVLLMT